MEYVNIPTDLIVQGLTDNEMIAVFKYQSLWALLERQPDDKTALRYMTHKQLELAKLWIDSIKIKVTSDIDSTNKRRTRQKKYYEKQKVSENSYAIKEKEIKEKEIKEIKEKNINTKKEKGKDFSPQFEQWWAECPRKVSKLDAKKSFERLLSDGVVGFDELMEGIKRYAEYCREQKTDERYIKHPSTWLNQGCWNDEPVEKRYDWEDMEWENV